MTTPRSAPRNTTSPVQVGDWTIDVARRRLAQGNTIVKLDRKASAVLEILLENRGTTVSKEEIFQAVWGNCFVSDEVLTTAIWELRRSLGDDAKAPRFIQTIPREGYRWIAIVSSVHRAGSTGRLLIWAAGAATAAFAVVVFWAVRKRRSSKAM